MATDADGLKAAWDIVGDLLDDEAAVVDQGAREVTLTKRTPEGKPDLSMVFPVTATLTRDMLRAALAKLRETFAELGYEET